MSLVPVPVPVLLVRGDAALVLREVPIRPPSIVPDSPASPVPPASDFLIPFLFMTIWFGAFYEI